MDVCVPPFCYGSSNVSVSLGKSNVNGDFKSVTEQSGLIAGDGGFRVNVTGNTDLAGAVIASSDRAIADELNSLTTGSLTQRDLDNHDTFDAEGYSVAVTFKGKLGDQKKPPKDAQLHHAQDDSSVGYGESSGDNRSTTRSGISGGVITISDEAEQQTRSGQSGERVIASLNRDVSTERGTSNALDKGWDPGELHNEINAQVQITKKFGQHSRQQIKDFARSRRKALYEQLSKAKSQGKSQAERDAIMAQIKDINLQERVMNVLIGALTGQAGAAATKESLSYAAEQLRYITIENSRKFAGVVDEHGNEITNLSGKSVGVRDDGTKGGGTRMDIDALCGENYKRCKVNDDGSLYRDEQDRVVFDSKNVGVDSLYEFLESEEGKKLRVATGGLQGWKGTLFGHPYEAGSWQDKLVEAFAGTHDVFGGQWSGYYDAEGNARQGLSDSESIAYDVWSVAAIVPSTPFAMAELLPPDVWQGIAILLRAGR